MSLSITLDSVGLVVLPSDIRLRLNLVPGTRLRLEVVAERIELTPEADPAPALVRKGKQLVLAPIGASFDAAAAVRAEREVQARRGDRK